MHSIAPLAPVDIGPYWTDEQIIMDLEKLKQGHSYGNVIADINPYQHDPSNLPVDSWYFTFSEQKKDSEHGFWKAKGDACKIFTNSSIDGWRKTLEFYKGQAPYGQRTNWLMQEYTVTQKGLRIGGNLKDSNMLCRVFHSTSEAISDQDMSLKLGGKIIAGSNHSLPKPSDTGSVNGQGCVRESQAMNNRESRGPLAAAGELLRCPVENISNIDCISRGDYLELDDLANPGSRLELDDLANPGLELDDLANPVSRSYSSYNTSGRTLTSDEVFDEWELIRDLEDEINKDAQEKNTNLKLSVAASARADEVVMMPATLESLTSSSGSKSPTRAVVDNKLLDKRVPENVVKSQKIENGSEGASSSRHVATSSNFHKAIREGEENALASRMKKLKKRFLCFLPF